MEKNICKKCGAELVSVPYSEEPGKPKIVSNIVGKAVSEMWESGESGCDRFLCKNCSTKYIDWSGNLIECSR